MEINETWVKRWAGSYTFLSCAHWGYQYFYDIPKVLGKSLKDTLFIHKHGTVSFFLKEDELKDMGEHVSEIAVNDRERTFELLETVKRNTDVLMDVMDELFGRIITVKEYERFVRIFDDFLGAYVFMKKTPDFAPSDVMEELFPYFRDTRIYSEEVYSRSEEFFRKLTALIGQKEGYNKDLLTCLKQEELKDYLLGKGLPSSFVLSDRFEACALHFKDGELIIISGKEALEIEKKIAEQQGKDLKGVCAYKGKVVGKCKIIFDPFAGKTVEDGEILVTGMTRPEFLPIMEKAAAIVTDVGGLLCHAAITSREMKTPCVIGTEKATQVLKDGDLIEVDAEKGIVRKIK